MYERNLYFVFASKEKKYIPIFYGILPTQPKLLDNGIAHVILPYVGLILIIKTLNFPPHQSNYLWVIPNIT